MNLNKLRTKLNKKFGEYSALSADDLKSEAYIPYGISANCLTLDLGIGRPGFPAGRLTELVGLESRGKSSTLYAIFAECQRLGGQAVLLESERAFEPDRLEQFGVKTDQLILCQPDNMEDAFGMIEENIQFIREDEKFEGPVVIAIDSVARLQTGAEEEGGYDDKHMGLAARVMSQGLRKIMGLVARQKIVLIFVNQLYHNMAQYGEEFSSYGGRSIRTSATLRIEFKTKKADMVMKGKNPLGIWTEAYIFKNKVGVPQKHVKYFFDYVKGIEPYEDLWQSAIHIGLIKATSQGNYKLGKETIIRREQWNEYVDTKFKSTYECRDALIKLAVQKNLITLYG